MSALRRVLPPGARRWLRLRRVAVDTALHGARLVARGMATTAAREDSNQGFVRSAYEDHYGVDLDAHRSTIPRPVVLGRRLSEATRAEIDAAHAGEHRRHLGPVLGDGVALEVGAGYGRTMWPLATSLPAARFVGIEPTVGGPVLASRFRRERADEIVRIARGAGGQSSVPSAAAWFVTGDGRRLPVPDDAVDVSYTNLVLEQIATEAEVRTILEEMARVTRVRCGFLEPWDDAQGRRHRAHLRSVDYLPAGSDLLRRLGFRDVQVHPVALHHNPRFRLAYVTAVPPA